MRKLATLLLLSLGMTTFLVAENLSVDTTSQSEVCCNPCCEQDEGWYLLLDTLLWKAGRNGLDYVLEADFDGSSIRQGRIHSMDFSWSVGVRAAIGYRLPCSRWDVKVEYTWFREKAGQHVNDVNGSESPNLFATRIHPLLTDGTDNTPDGDNPPESPTLDGPWVSGHGQLENGAGRMDVNYNVLDFLLGHAYCPCPSIELHPFVGIRVLFLSQRLENVDYKRIDYAPEDDGLRWESDFTAYGVHGGTDVAYHVCGDFSFTGTVAASCVAGSVDNRQRQTGSSNPGLQETSNDRFVDVIEADTLQTACGCHGALGLQWQRCCGDTVVTCVLGYEVHKWTNVPELRRFYNATAFAVSGMPTGELGFHGFFSTLRVDF